MALSRQVMDALLTRFRATRNFHVPRSSLLCSIRIVLRSSLRLSNS